jgi:hypothetical protein
MTYKLKGGVWAPGRLATWSMAIKCTGLAQLVETPNRFQAVQTCPQAKIPKTSECRTLSEMLSCLLPTG